MLEKQKLGEFSSTDGDLDWDEFMAPLYFLDTVPEMKAYNFGGKADAIVSTLTDSSQVIKAQQAKILGVYLY